jgi:rubrerythrin
MGADVKCIVCQNTKITTLNTSWVSNANAGYCPDHGYWHYQCHVISQCPICGKYTK